jgi:glycosyltransferase involved in cell wall biosynthesis
MENKRIIFASGDYPFFGGAATNVYALIKYFKFNNYNVIGLILNTSDLKKENYDPENIGCMYHIRNFDNKSKIKEDIIKMLNGIPDNIYIKKTVIGLNLRTIFTESKIYYILSSVIDSDKLENIKKNDVFKNTELIPDVIQKLTLSEKIIVNSELSKKILLNYNNKANIDIAYTSFLINSNKHYDFLNIKNNQNDDWDNRIYDIGFIASCCNRTVKNIKLFKEIVNNPIFNCDVKLIIGKNSSNHSDIKNSIWFDLLNHDEILEKLKKTKLIIISSIYESLSNLMIESIMCGCNILISDTIGGREFINDNCVANNLNDFINKANILKKNKINCIKDNFNYTINDLVKGLYL